MASNLTKTIYVCLGHWIIEPCGCIQQGPARLLVSVLSKNWSFYGSRQGIGLGIVQSSEPWLESESEPSDLQNRVWNQNRNRQISITETGISIKTVKESDFFRVRDQESVSELLKNQTFKGLRQGLGIGTIGSPESRLESVSEPLDLQNRDWNWYRNR